MTETKKAPAKRKPAAKKRGPKPKAVPMVKANRVLDLMSKHGKSLRQACQASNVAPGTFIDWVNKDKELAERYARAREDLIDHIADETMMIADEEHREHEVFEYDDEGNVIRDENGEPAKVMKLIPVDVQRSRLRVDTRKWLLSKLAPKKYGEKITHSGDAENPVSVIIRGDDANL